MSILEQVRDWLKTNHADLRYTEKVGVIIVQSPVPNGFDVSITEDLIVGYDGWHEHCDSPERALECFEFGFSDRCRLKVTYRGKLACMWTVERLEEGRWIRGWTTGLLLFPFWRRARVEYRQNGVVKRG